MRTNLLLLIFFISGTQFLFSQSLPVVVENTSSSKLPIRSGPGGSFSKITDIASGKKLVAFEQNGDWYKVYIPYDDLPPSPSPTSGWVEGTSGKMEPDYSNDQIRLTNTEVLIRFIAGGLTTNQLDLIWIFNGESHEFASTDINQRYALISSQSVGGTTWYKIDLTENCRKFNGGTSWTKHTVGWISGQYSIVIPPPPPPPANDFIDVSDNSLNFGPQQGSQVIEIESNVNWTVDENCSWVSISPENGNDNGSITISVNENFSNNSKTCEITISGGDASETISINQNGTGTSDFLDLSPSTIFEDSNGGSETIDVSSNISWNVSNNCPSWVNIFPTSGNGNGEFEVTIAQNSYPNPRSCDIQISGGGLTETIGINQSGAQNTTDLSIQGITIRADNIDPSGNIRTASGNVRIGKNGCGSALFFEGDLTINMSTPSQEFISGNGIIFVTNIPGHGTINLYNGPYSFNIVGNNLSEHNSILSLNDFLFRLVLLKLEFSKLEVLCDGLRLEGLLEMPEILQYAIGNDNLKAEINTLQLTTSNGIEMAGKVGFGSNLLKVKNILTVKDLNLCFDSIEDEFHGSTNISTPIINFGIAAWLIEGKLDGLELEGTLDDCSKIPIGTTGLAFSGASGSVSNLANPNKNVVISIGGKAVLNIPCELPYDDVFEMEFTGAYTLGNSFTANGTLNLFHSPTTNSQFEISRNKIEAGIDLDYVLLKGNADIGFQKNTDFTFGAGAFLTFQKPSVWPSGTPWIIEETVDAAFDLGFIPPVSVASYLYGNFTQKRYFLSGYLDLDFCLNLPIHNICVPAVFVNLDWQNGVLIPQIGTNYSIIPPEAQENLPNPNQSGSGLLPFNNSEKLYYTLRYATPTIVITAENEGGLLPDYEIVLPYGDTINSNNYMDYGNIQYNISATNDKAYFSIDKPIVGDYVVIDNTADSIAFFTVNNAPYILVYKVEHDPQNKTVTIHWKDSDPDSDAKITLAFDDNSEGVNGITIASDLEENDQDNQFFWHYDTIPTGNYYIYAVIQDEIGQAAFSYAQKRVKLLTFNAPAAPSGLTAVPTDTSIILNWSINAPSPFTQIIYYSTEPNTVSYNSPSLGVADLNTFEFKTLPPGGYIEFMVTQIDDINRESNNSNIASLNWVSSESNNAPRIIQQNFPDVAYIGNSYSYQILTKDEDADPLTFLIKMGPVGMTIDNNGQLSWMPDFSQGGMNGIRIEISDPSGATDEVFFQVNVLNEITSKGKLRFNKILYVDYDDLGLISLGDRNFTGSPNQCDTVSVRVYSSSDSVGVTIDLIENFPNSRELVGYFEFTNSSSSGLQLLASPGDLIKVEFTDTNPVTTLSDFAYFSAFQSDFSFQDTICSGDELKFLNTATGDGMSYFWDFGDSTFSEVKHPTHIFEAKNMGDSLESFTVTLSITDNQFRTISSIQTVHVIQKPAINLEEHIEACDSIFLSAGNPFNDILWSTGDTSPTLNLDESGLYWVQAINDFGCRTVDTFTLALTNNMEITFTTQDNMCFDGNEGAIDLQLTGGVGDFTYLWSNGSTSEDISNLEMGNYEVTVTDTNGCQRIKASDINAPDPIETDVFISSGCGGNNASIVSLFPRGGQEPYTFQWDTGDTTNSVFFLSAGIYSITISDGLNCSIVEEVEVEYVEPLIIEVDKNHVSCFGAQDGSIDIHVSGGIPPYSYSWSNGETSEDLGSLGSGTYTLNVLTSGNCSVSLFIEIGEPSELNLTFDITPSTDGLSSDVSIMPIGGVPPYDATWSTGQTGLSVNDLPIGDYTVVLVDGNGCEKKDSLSILITATRDIKGLSEFKFFPNPASEVLYIEARLQQKEAVEISLFNFGGQLMYRNKTEGIELKQQIDLHSFAAGTYLLELKTPTGSLVEKIIVVK